NIDGMPFRPVVELTALGVSVMKSEAPPPAALADLAPTTRAPRSKKERARSTPSDLSESELALFEKLREARLILARDADAPAFFICHDSTLRAIAKTAPQTVAALEKIKGFGAKR